MAVACPSYNEFLAGRCQCNNGINQCFYMGYKANQLVSSLPAKMDKKDLLNVTNHQPPEEIRAYLITGATRPFCRKLIHFFKLFIIGIQ